MLKHVEIIRRMQAQYGDNCLSRSKISELSTSRPKNNIQVVERIVRENRRITVDDTAGDLNISHGSAYSNLL
jgi:hypothetical protein